MSSHKLAVLIAGPFRYADLVLANLEKFLRAFDFDVFFLIWKSDLGNKIRDDEGWAIEDLLANASSNVGLCLDTAWALDSGDDPIELAKTFQERLYGVHIKDFIFDRAGKPGDVIVGSGNLDLPALATFLTEIDYQGYLTLEYEGDEYNPTPALKECVDAIRSTFASAQEGRV